DRMCGVVGIVGVVGDPVEIRVEGVAEHGERDEGLALKKRAAKFLLQADNGIGQRGLGNAAAFGRAGEITLLAERQKVADLVHLHVPPRGINRGSCRRLPSAPVSKCEVVHTQRHTPCLIIANSISCNPALGGERMQFDQLKRREVITPLCGAVAWPVTVHAQQSGKLPTIGFLGQSTRSATSEWTAAFVQRLRELGWIDGRNVAIEYRWAEGRPERNTEIAAEFVRLKVDVIVT